MLEEKEQQPTSIYRTHPGENPRPISFHARLPIDNYVPEDFRDFFSDSEYDKLYSIRTDFNYGVPTTADIIARQQRHKVFLPQHQHDVHSFEKQALKPFDYPWSNGIGELHLARTEDELFDAVISEFAECLDHQFDRTTQRFMDNYDRSAVEDNIAAFESEFLDLLIEADGPLRKAVFRPEKEILNIFRKLYAALPLVLDEYPPWKLGLSECCVCVVILRPISSPKQQQRHTTRAWAEG